MHIEGLDHVHVEVSDREAAAEWYGRVLGLVRSRRLNSWGKSLQGPMMLATPDDVTTLALFQWNDAHRPKKPRSRDNTVAFRVSGDDFISFLHKMPDHYLIGTRTGKRIISPQEVIDHQMAWSLYFLDPDENCIELTTYDYENVATYLSAGA